MTKIAIAELESHIDETVTIGGWVDVRRDHGKLIFMDIRDGRGYVQSVVLPEHAEALEVATTLRSEDVVLIEGKVNKRPERMIKEGQQNGTIELEVLGIEILSKAQELPFDHDADLNLETLLDFRPLTLRRKEIRDIFTLQATIVQAYRWSLIQQGFMEFQAPALVGGDAEGGAEAFKVEYYKDRTAFLATSPQLYKEIMVGAFEKVFTIAKIFRGEKSATTRHLSEITQMDFELGFVKDHTDVMKVLEQVIRDVSKAVTEQHQDIFERFKTTAPAIPEQPFPVYTLAEAQEILSKEFGLTDAIGEPDMEPEHERKICEWALKEHGSDFVFITHFPTAKRGFYTHEDPENPELSYSFDLIHRGLEINSGARRLDNYDKLVAKLESKGLDPKKFHFYLQAFKFGIPPHGGCSTGLERITARMLDLKNVKEATAFPRDINRIDSLLSKEEKSTEAGKGSETEA